MSSRFAWVAAALLCAVVVVWTYFPVLTARYAYNDDYPLLKRVAEGTCTATHNEFIEQGRPIMGWVIPLLYSIPHSVDEVRTARIVSVAGILLFALVALVVLRANRFGPAFSAAASLAMCLTPGFAVYAGWLTNGFDSYAAAAGLAAGHLVGVAVDAAGRGRRALLSCLGCALLLLVYATYQPAAAFAVVAVLARTWRGGELKRGRIRAFLVSVSILVAVAGLYYAVYKAAVATFGVGGLSSRAELAPEPLSGLRYVATTVLWSGLTGWGQFHAGTAAWLTGVLTAAGVLSACLAGSPKGRGGAVRGAACVVLALFLSVLPQLLLRERHFVFRTQTALHAAVGFLFLAGAGTWMRRALAPSRARLFRGIAFGCLIVLASLVTRFHLERDFVAPNVRELQLLRKEVAGITGDYPGEIVFFSTEPAWLNPRQNGEYGDLSSPAWWNVQAMLTLILDEQYAARRGSRLPAPPFRPPEVLPAQGTQGTRPVVDGFGALSGGRATVLDDPYWGRLRCLPSGWCASDWFGCFAKRNPPWIYVEGLGEMYRAGRGLDDYWFWSGKLGWFWTSPEAFPSIYRADSGSWAFLRRSSNLECWCYDYEKKQWSAIL